MGDEREGEGQVRRGKEKEEGRNGKERWGRQREKGVREKGDEEERLSLIHI